MSPEVKSTVTPGDGGPHLFAIKIVDKIVANLKGKMSAVLLDTSTTWADKLGHFGFLAAAAVGFLFFLILTIRSNQFTSFLYAFAWVIAVFVIQYIAYKFAGAGNALVTNNPTQMSSRIFLDCVGFLAMLGGIAYLIFMIIQAISFKSFNVFLIGLGVFVVLEFLSIVAFNPDRVTMQFVKETTAGQEAIGIITFFMKAFMKLVPIVFCVGIAVYTVMMFINMLGLFSDAKIQGAIVSGMKSARMILFFGLLPFISYVIFVLYFLFIDVIRAILSIPGKLDELKK